MDWQLRIYVGGTTVIKAETCNMISHSLYQYIFRVTKTSSVLSLKGCILRVADWAFLEVGPAYVYCIFLESLGRQ